MFPTKKFRQSKPPFRFPSFLTFYRSLSLFIFLTVSSYAVAATCHELISVIRLPSVDKSAIATVKVAKFISEFESLAAKHPDVIRLSTYGQVGDFDLVRLDVNTAIKPDAPTILITGGIHGNETLGALANIEFLKKFMSNKELNSKFNLVILPATNPKALTLGKRKYHPKVDMNRLFKDKNKTPEVLAVKETLEGQEFAMLLDLHGGPTRTHFFSIRAAEDHGLAEKAMRSLPKELILESNNKNYPGKMGIPSDPDRYVMPARGVAESKLVGTFKAYGYDELKIPFAYSVEYPMRNNIETSLDQYVNLVEAFLKSYESTVMNKD